MQDLIGMRMLTHMDDVCLVFHTECNPIIVIGLFIEACARLNWCEDVDIH